MSSTDSFVNPPTVSWSNEEPSGVQLYSVVAELSFPSTFYRQDSVSVTEDREGSVTINLLVTPAEGTLPCEFEFRGTFTVGSCLYGKPVYVAVLHGATELGRTGGSTHQDDCEEADKPLIRSELAHSY